MENIPEYGETDNATVAHKCRFSFPITPVSKTVILEPIDFESEAEENKFKAKWRKIHRHLNQYGLGHEIKVRPKPFLKCTPCKIRVNNYMKHSTFTKSICYDSIHFILCYKNKERNECYNG